MVDAARICRAEAAKLFAKAAPGTLGRIDKCLLRRYEVVSFEFSRV
jgi:hypothetical protein